MSKKEYVGHIVVKGDYLYLENGTCIRFESNKKAEDFLMKILVKRGVIYEN